MLAINNTGNDQHAPGKDAAQTAFFQLSRQLAHDFNNIWARIFGLTQQAKEMPGFQDRDEVLDKIGAASSSGLLYSRNIMQILMDSGADSKVFDACEVIREWAYESGEMLQDGIDISCLIPPYALHVDFKQNTLRLILLSLIGYVLRSGETKRWTMIGVRSVSDDKRAGTEAADSVDIMFLCRLTDYRGSDSGPQFQKRVDAITALVGPYAGTTNTWVVPNVGVNLRIRLPLMAAPEAPPIASRIV